MTNQRTPQSSADQLRQDRPSNKGVSVAITDAELRDEGGQVVSKGEAHLSRDDKVVLFYPHDRAPQDTIQSRAKILFRNDLSEALAIAGFGPCLDQISDKLHVHVILK